MSNEIKTEINVEFEEAPSRQEIQSGEEIKTLFGKLKKWLKDLKTVAFSGSYKDLSDKPEIPVVNNAKLTIQKNGTAVKNFTANASADVTANITVPIKVSELENDAGYKTIDTTYSNFVKSGSGAKSGLVPAPSTTAGTTKYLREDGTWQVPPDTNTTYSNMTAATASAAGKAGLVPAPAAGKQTSFLRGDGTWVVPTDTNTDTKVTQTNTATNANYRLVLSGNANDTTETTTARKSSKFTANPSTGVLTATTFSGNASSATTISAAQTSLYTGSSLNTTPVTVEITGLFTKYKAVICNISTANSKDSSSILPLSYVKTFTVLPYYEDKCGHYFRYIDDNTMTIYTGFAQSNPKINNIEIISLY